MYTSSIQPLTFLSSFACSAIPVLRKPVFADSFTLSSKDDRADVTISFARQTVLIDDRERFEARRWVTKASRGISLGWDWEADGESDA